MSNASINALFAPSPRLPVSQSPHAIPPPHLPLTSPDGLPLEAAFHATPLIPAAGAVIIAHGLTGDMHEGGLFDRLAASLSRAGFNVLHFSYRAHGNSGGSPRGLTIAGEMLDLQAALDAAATRFNALLSIVAFSFGAVSACLSLPYIEHKLKGLVLWNPVLSLEKIFIRPTLPWGQANFNQDAVQDLYTRGYLLLDGAFEIGRVLYQEMHTCDTYHHYVKSALPAIIIHAENDTHIPYPVSKDASREHANCELLTMEASNHLFDAPGPQAQIINLTAN